MLSTRIHFEIDNQSSRKSSRNSRRSLNSSSKRSSILNSHDIDEERVQPNFIVSNNNNDIRSAKNIYDESLSKSCMFRDNNNHDNNIDDHSDKWYSKFFEDDEELVYSEESVDDSDYDSFDEYDEDDMEAALSKLPQMMNLRQSFNSATARRRGSITYSSTSSLSTATGGCGVQSSSSTAGDQRNLPFPSHFSKSKKGSHSCADMKSISSIATATTVGLFESSSITSMSTSNVAFDASSVSSSLMGRFVSSSPTTPVMENKSSVYASLDIEDDVEEDYTLEEEYDYEEQIRQEEENEANIVRKKIEELQRKMIRDEFCSMTRGLHRAIVPVERDMRTLQRDDLVVLQQGQFSSHHVTTQVGIVRKGQCYDCKSLNTDATTNEPSLLIEAATSLMYESRVLSSLDHPNIIKIQGWGNTSTNNSVGAAASTSGFFFLREIIQETLEDRIQRWSNMTDDIDNDPSSSSLLTGSWSNYPREPGTKDGLRDHFAYHLRNIEKYHICQQLSSALQYIHSKNVVYKDLKPSKIGFESPSLQLASSDDSGGTLKLLDFEASRTMDYCFTTHNANQMNNFMEDNEATNTMISSSQSSWSNTNEYHYMSPEVYAEQQQSDTNNNTTPIDYSCDVYSFAMVCWKVFSHRTPFESITKSMFEEFVGNDDCRPVKNPMDDDVFVDQPQLFQHFHEWTAPCSSIESSRHEQIISTPSKCSWNEDDSVVSASDVITESMNAMTITAAPLSPSSSTSSSSSTSRKRLRPRPGKVPEDLYTLLCQCWKSKPTSRIGWDEIQMQFTLLRQLEELTVRSKAPTPPLTEPTEQPSMTQQEQYSQ